MLDISFFSSITFLISFFRRILDQVNDLGEARKKRRESFERLTLAGYIPLNLKFDRLDWVPPPIDYAFLTFKRLGMTSLLTIFLQIVTMELMTNIMENIDPVNIS